MSSEFLASGENVLDSNLGGAWDIINGYAGRKRDLGIARRFGGAAAAYSLRDIGAMNGSVVRVRREPTDTTAGIDDEERFSANQVQDGTLERWVNGELESTLPADVATAAAAYSLRKVKADYSGDAVRIRRTSDNIEVDVAFDSDDKVSASSAITNVAEQGGESGSTTATTLAGFLSEERTTFVTNPNFSAVSDVTLDSQTITNTTASVTFSGATGNGFIRDNSKPANIGAETGDTVSFDVTASGLNAQAGIRIRVVGANTDIISPAVNDIDNGTQNVSFTVGANSPAGYFAFTNLSTASSATITVSNLKVVGKSATVHTWYDQAGSNNAVQATAANQPKIAESGALLADGLDFDGINDELETGANITGSTINGFVVANLDGTDGKSLYSVGDTKPNVFFGNPSLVYAINGGNALSGGTAPTLTDTLFSSLFISGGTSKGFINAVEVSSGDAGSNSASSDKLTIGNLESGDRFMNGSMKELILYTSDQSANRFKIESNINNYYGLYNDELELNGEALPASSAIIGGVTYSSGTLVTLPNKNSLEYTLNDAETGNRFMRYMVNPNGNLTNLSNGDEVYISFNLTAPDGLTIIAQLRDNFTGVSSTSSFSGSGFKSFPLIRNSTAGTIDNIMFQSSGVGNATISMTDIKVSRIARNGFVETLYDQSGNGNDATQASAGNQPAIVQNGGINSDGVRFDGVNDYMDFNTSLNAPLWSFIAHRATKNNSAVFGVTAIYDIWLGRRSTSTFIQVVTGVLSGGIYTDSTVLRTDKVDADGAEIFSNGTSLASGDNATSNLGSWGRLGGQGQLTSTKFLEGNIKEAVFYTTDKTSDRTEIETEINNHYNIF